uniref:BPTI/Kunitz inhibitor domain-containing protein n=1 Tax=Amphilophus citrinellus TaxID=61819 RepID=A0A3Q0QZR3_AMPCI
GTVHVLSNSDLYPSVCVCTNLGQAEAVSSTQKNSCQYKLDDEAGPCRAIKDRYFFNVNSGRCELFEYGGCGGNKNNFETLEECEETCLVSAVNFVKTNTNDKKPCHLPEAPGPCRGMVLRYFFDSSNQQCRRFYYGGCFGNANNFRTMAECQAKCLSPGRPGTHFGSVDLHQSPQKLSRSEPCFTPVDRGMCDGAERRFAYNPEKKRCQSFSYSGCGGNENNFISRKHCIHKCIRKGGIILRHQFQSLVYSFHSFLFNLRLCD